MNTEDQKMLIETMAENENTPLFNAISDSVKNVLVSEQFANCLGREILVASARFISVVIRTLVKTQSNEGEMINLNELTTIFTEMVKVYLVTQEEAEMRRAAEYN